MRFGIKGLLQAGILLLFCVTAFAATPLKPFLKGQDMHAPLESAMEKTKGAFEAEGFRILAEYFPYEGAGLLLLTRPDQLEAAAGSELGPFAAVSRVSFTQAGDVLQTACFNPDWMAASCRLNSTFSSVRPAMERVLGELEPFGSEKGIMAKGLRKYHYMFGMPYFDDVLELAEYDSQAKALQAVEAGLKAEAGSCRKLARVDIPGRDAVLYCVAIGDGAGADEKVMATCDTGELKHTAHLPYEMLVVDGRVLALHAKFRIANSFPDLTMGTFMKIVKAPGAIEKALEAVAQPK